LPQDQLSAYLENESSIHEHRRSEFFPNNEIINPQTHYAGNSPVSIKGRDKVIYTIKPNDNLGLISAWFKVRVSDLKYWNNLRKNFIKAGQKLTIYVPEGQGEYYTKISKQSYSEKQKSLNRKPTVNSSQNLASTAKHSDKSSESANKKTKDQTADNGVNEDSKVNEKGDFVFYTVRKGDNFWSIAKKFPGVSNFDIMRMNNIKEARSLKVGQVLKISPKA
jgi:membrane-bound lytic murein transglycosylase D